MDFAGANWAILNIVGPLLILIVLGWAFYRNRKAKNPRDIERTERATHELYDEEEETRRREDEHR